MSSLPVYFERRIVGSIDVDAEGPRFTYHPDWLTTRGAFPVSTLMPLSPEPVEPGVFMSWAANFLPEGEQLRTVSQCLGIAPGDVIGLLSQLGRDTAGALSNGRPGSTSPGHWRPIEHADDLERIINELPSKPSAAARNATTWTRTTARSRRASHAWPAGTRHMLTTSARSTF